MHPETNSATSTIEGWHGALTEITSLGDVLCGAIEQDDLVSAIGAMMQLRRARTSIERIDVTDAAAGVDRETLHVMRGHVARSQQISALMSQWLGRDRPDDAVLLASPLGVAVLADFLLPAIWDFERDLVVLIGDTYAPVVNLLSDIGQQRIVFCGEGEVPAGVSRVRTALEATTVVARMTPVSPRHVAWRVSDAVATEHADAIRAAVRSAVEGHAVTVNTRAAFGRKWFDQGARNLPAIAKWPTVAAVGERFAGKPLILVAPGPSLAKNVDQLAQLKGKAIIACVSHALKAVLAAGVTPDLVMSLDPDDCSYHFANCDVSQSFLLNGATVYPSLYELEARGIMSFAANGETDRWIYDGLEALPTVQGGGSVTTSLFSLALEWKCNPIIFVGLDLSFPDNKFYVSTSTDGDARVEVQADGTVQVVGLSSDFHAMAAKDSPGAPAEELHELDGWLGGKVPTNFSLALFHRWFTERLALGVEATVYNCTEGGAWIEGALHRPLAEVRATLEGTVDVAALLDPVMRTDEDQRAEKLVRHMGAVAGRIKRVRQLATHANTLIERAASERELQRAERALVKALAPISFVSLLAQREVQRAFAIANHEATATGYLAASSLLFRQLVSVCDHLLPVMVEAEAHLTTRRHGHP